MTTDHRTRKMGNNTEEEGAHAMSSPYPDLSEHFEVVDVEDKSHLHLTRSIAAVKNRKGDDAKYVLSKPYRAIVTIKSGQSEESESIEVEVPLGYMSDLMSVPKLARGIVNRVGPYLESAILHDWLYDAWLTLPGECDERGHEESESQPSHCVCGVSCCALGWR